METCESRTDEAERQTDWSQRGRTEGELDESGLGSKWGSYAEDCGDRVGEEEEGFESTRGGPCCAGRLWSGKRRSPTYKGRTSAPGAGNICADAGQRPLDDSYASANDDADTTTTLQK
jgi:hypothetical protein